MLWLLNFHCQGLRVGTAKGQKAVAAKRQSPEHCYHHEDCCCKLGLSNSICSPFSAFLFPFLDTGRMPMMLSFGDPRQKCGQHLSARLDAEVLLEGLCPPPSHCWSTMCSWVLTVAFEIPLRPSMNCASILNYPKLNNLGNLVGYVYFAYLPIILYHPVDSVSGQNFPPPVFWRLLRISVDHHLLRSECHSSLGLAQVGRLSIHTNNVKMWEFVWHFVITSVTPS